MVPAGARRTCPVRTSRPLTATGPRRAAGGTAENQGATGDGPPAPGRKQACGRPAPTRSLQTLPQGKVVAATVHRFTIACLLGRHERSGRSARLDPGSGDYVSKCKHCGVGMRRVAPKQWVVQRRGGDAPARSKLRAPAAVWLRAAAGAAAVGAALGSAALDTISEARAGGYFGRAMTPVETDLPAAARDEELAEGGATAAALKIDSPAGCSRIAAKLRRGCLRYVQSLR